ncbi:MAG: signal peptidase I [Candidatus Aminicenantaceae bacterium]
MDTLEEKKQSLIEPLSEIFIDQLSRGNSIRMTIKGRSMHPFIKRNDVVTVKPIKLKETRIGDIIAYRRGSPSNTLTLHRMIIKRQNYIVTKGDANRHGDPPIYLENIFGKAIIIERNCKVINLETRFNLLASCLIACHSWSLAVLREVIAHPHLVLIKIWRRLKG